MASHQHHHQHYSHNPPNPLRPYYIPPPSIPFDSALPDPTSVSSVPGPTANNAPSSYTILQDFQDYSSDYLEAPSVGESARAFLDQALLQYASVLISQPFEVAKTVLQCQYVPKHEGKPKQAQPRNSTAAEEQRDAEEEEEKSSGEEDNPWTFEDEAEDSDDEPKYFSSNISPGASPSLQPSGAPPTGSRKMTDRAGYVLEEKEGIPRPDYQIRKCNSAALNDAVKALWAKEGAWGIWKGTNVTFVHAVLVKTVEAWAASFLSAIFSLPDPGMTDIADSIHPMASLSVSIAASTLTALMLSPLDTVRTKLMLTPSSSRPRNLLPALRSLPGYIIPNQLIVPTVLHAIVPSFISLSTPYFLRTKLTLDPLLTPISYNFCSFFGSMTELFARLPLETVLRRAQLAAAKPEKTIVPVGRYAGVVGTAWVLMKEEETGRWGIESLYRGWRSGAWSNIGVLGLGLFGVPQAQSNEF